MHRLKWTQQLFLIILAAIFAVGLTFASIEGPRLADRALQRQLPTLSGDSHGSEANLFRTELFIRHYRLRWIGYGAFLLLLALIAAGFASRRTGLASAGAMLLFLPAFGGFALTMFFLAGLGLFNLLWLPFLDWSLDVMKLGDIVFFPVRLLERVLPAGIHIRAPLAVALMGLGLLIFFLGTLAWLVARFQRKGVADFWIYRFSRHPQYLGWIVWSYGLILSPLNRPDVKRAWDIDASLPWLLATMVILGVALLEELKMRRSAGEEYDAYRGRAPFLFPLPRGLGRLLLAPLRLFFGTGWPQRKREVVVLLFFYTALLVGLTPLADAVLASTEKPDVRFEPVASRDVPELVERFVSTPDRRARYRVVEALIACGPAAVAPLIGLLGHGDVTVREFSAEALGRLKAGGTVDLIAPLLQDASNRVRTAAAAALGAVGSDEAFALLERTASDPQSPVRAWAAVELGRARRREALGTLIRGLEQGDSWGAYATALGNIGDPEAVPALCSALANTEPMNRRAAALALYKIDTPEAATALRRLVDDGDDEVRLYAAAAIRRSEVQKR